ncbi:helix-turn-helix transcriptional regulator [Microcoleus sp. A006_D1]|uniref:helix-turn-helix domain-containing protein n=1 Tax=Microcoleus sp. A006_D1 TaxID=3055267 RepID=UPI002FD71DDC
MVCGFEFTSTTIGKQIGTMIIEISTLGEAIVHKRCLLGLTQASLAKKLGVDNTYISKIENNHSIPNRELLRKLENVLSFEYGELLPLAGLHSQELEQLFDEVVTLIGEKQLMKELENIKYNA